MNFVSRHFAIFRMTSDGPLEIDRQAKTLSGFHTDFIDYYFADKKVTCERFFFQTELKNNSIL
jgi:hypothetical protein